MRRMRAIRAGAGCSIPRQAKRSSSPKTRMWARLSPGGEEGVDFRRIGSALDGWRERIARLKKTGAGFSPVPVLRSSDPGRHQMNCKAT